MNLQYDPLSRARRRQRFILTASVLGISLFCLLAWALRELILPIVVGALLAYLCHPLLAWMQRKSVPKGVGVLSLLTVFGLTITLVSNQIREAIPDEQGKLELQVRIQYKLNERYRNLMELDEQGKGNMLYSLVGQEIAPAWQKLNNMLSLPAEEQDVFERYYRQRYGNERFDQPYYRYFLHNTQQYNHKQPYLITRQAPPPPADGLTDTQRPESPAASSVQSGSQRTPQQTALSIPQMPPGQQQEASTGLLATLGGIISLWLAAPFVFLFVLLDEGDIKKNLVLLVPNRYFEMTLTVIHNVDDALGRYLRGTFVECSLVGFTLMIGLFVIGVEAKWAFIIGTVAGLANAIPFLGPAIGLVVGLMYALVVEEFSPLLSFINSDNMVIWVVIAVGITQLLDNVFFQPVVLGNAVSLHPLVVIIGVMGGSILLGFTGMLFAIPVIVILKVIIGTLIKEMKAYQII